MHRNYVVFGDIEGKLDVLRECTKCQPWAKIGTLYMRKSVFEQGHGLSIGASMALFCLWQQPNQARVNTRHCL
jgi:hypothetical protein